MFAFQSNRKPYPARISLRTRAARAFSLLEVSIALAIFVFGALAVVQIFPGALKVIGTGGDRQNAIGLNRATLARVQNNPPLATYDTHDYNTWEWQDGITGPMAEPRAVLASAHRGYSLPRNNMADIDRSALGSLRAIIGEPETVQLDAGNNPFVLTQFPIFGDSLSPTSVRVWTRDALEGVTVDNTGKLHFDDARFSLSGGDFTHVPGDIYYVTFRYHDNTNLWGVSEAPTLDTLAVPDVAPAEVGAGATTRVVAGNVAVTCARLIATVPAPVAAGDEGDNKRGYVKLPSGISGTIYLDYQADWGWLLQTGVPDAVPEDVPTGATRPRQIALGAPFIEDRADKSVYTLCQTMTGTQITLTPATFGETTPPSSGSKLYPPTTSDLRAGRLTFETDVPGGTFAGARVAFRTRDGWAQQLSVAASAYKPYGCGPDTGTAAYNPNGEPWRDYILGGDTLYFHASEAGKGVLVTYTYKDTVGNSVTLRDRLLSIDDQPIQNLGLDTSFSAKGFAAPLQLTEADGSPITNLVSITEVRGASVAVRTAWLDGSRYTQSFLTAVRSGAGAEAMQ